MEIRVINDEKSSEFIECLVQAKFISDEIEEPCVLIRSLDGKKEIITLDKDSYNEGDKIKFYIREYGSCYIPTNSIEYHIDKDIAKHIELTFTKDNVKDNRSYKETIYNIFKTAKNAQVSELLDVLYLLISLAYDLYDDSFFKEKDFKLNLEKLDYIRKLKNNSLKLSIGKINEYIDFLERKYGEFLEEKFKEKFEFILKNRVSPIHPDMNYFDYLKEKKYEKSSLEKYGIFLNENDYKYNPTTGREEELKNLMIALMTEEKSVMLTSEAGVGKTNIVEGLVYKIQNNLVPEALSDIKIVKINFSALISGCIYRGSYEERLENVIEEVIENNNIILFLDELHMFTNSGSINETISVANMLKPYLDRGTIKVIGATTNDEYNKFINSDKAFKRRFVRINIMEPTEEVLYRILKDYIKRTNEKYNFIQSIDEIELIIDAIISVTKKSHRVYNDRLNNPDLALTILELAYASARYAKHSKLEKEDLIYAIKSNDRLYETARRNSINSLEVEFEENLEENSVSKIIKFPG